MSSEARPMRSPGSYSALTVESYLDSGNAPGLLSYIFSGADTLNGSPQSDVLNGFAGDDKVYGNGGNDLLEGGSCNDLLNGGAGADALLGGSGNDTYYVDNTGDKVYETTTVGGTTNAGGTDTVRSILSYTLGNFVEKLVLAGTSAINGTGNTLANSLTGNAAANTLNGGSGADTMLGAAGSDTYVVDNVGDKVYETTTVGSTINAGGTDTVRSSVSYALGSFVEKLVLAGASAINGTGNTLANSLTGNVAANILNGGSGADTMLGAAGSDTYVVDNVGDKVYETTTVGSTINAGGTGHRSIQRELRIGQFRREPDARRSEPRSTARATRWPTA